MDNFFVVEKKTRYLRNEETYEYKYLDQRKVYAAMEEAKTVNDFIPLLKVLQEDDDTELDHIMADDVVAKVLRMLGQNELADEYEKIDKWYS